MKKTFAATLFVLAFAVSGFAQGVCTRHTETAGGYSFCPPAGWTLKDQAGQKFKIFIGPTGDGFTPNINVQGSDSTAALSVYTDDAVKGVLLSAEKLGANSITLISRTAFITDSKLRGIKVVFRTDYRGILIYSAQYLFDTGKGKLLVSGASLESDKAVHEKLFDAALKTFKIG